MPKHPEVKPDWYEKKKKIHWVPRAPARFATCFTVIFTKPEVVPSDWHAKEGRERDYADVLALSKVHPVKARRLRHALEQTAAHRGTQLMPLAQALDTLPPPGSGTGGRFSTALALPPCPRASRKP